MIAGQARLLERDRIARDMHDSLGHQLTLVSVHTGALEVDPDMTPQQREALQILREPSMAAMHELREAVGILRDEPHPAPHSPPADTAAGRPVPRVVAFIDGLVEASKAAGAAVELRRSGTPRPLAPAADHTAYRIVQEGLTNAHRHSPGAPVTVDLRYEPDSLVVEVANGPVPDASRPVPPVVSGGQGLAGLRERARLIGGMVHTGPTADGGFRLADMLPYETRKAGSERRRPGVLDDAPLISATSGGEFARAITSKHRMLIGCGGIAAVLVAAFLALVIWGVMAFMDEVDKAAVSPSVYRDATVGSPERDVQKRLPDEDSFLTADLEREGPPVPEGARCRHFYSADPDDDETVYRFCFRDGKLVAKAAFKETW